VRGVRIGQCQVVVAQQSRHMGPARFTPFGIGQHHDVCNGQRGRHGLGRTGVDFVVQHRPVGMLWQMEWSGHAGLLPAIVYWR
jgi:hypothetical protein